MATTPSDKTVRVLFVDDDADDYALIKELLAETQSPPKVVDWASTYEDGIAKMCSGNYDVALLDYRLGAQSGLDLLGEARRRNCETPVVVLTGLSNAEIDLEAMRQGADYYLEKTRLDSTILGRTIRYVIQQREFEERLEQRVRERTEELDRANEALRIASERKDEFIATLAHELRNPLAPIRNALEIMRISKDDPQVVGPARSLLDRQVKQLIRLIDDLLDLSRITRGKFRITPERMDVADAVHAALEQSRPMLEAAEQKITVTVPEEPIYVHGDRVRLAQVLTNLLNNSAKYSEPGGQVTVTVARHDGEVSIVIEDTGLGIEASQLAHIFEPFTQVGRDAHRNSSGLGIGLNLARNLVEMHNGTITAMSDGANQGAQFTVRLPIVE